MTEHFAQEGLSIDPIEGGFGVTGAIDIATVDRFREAAASGASQGIILKVLELAGLAKLPNARIAAG